MSRTSRRGFTLVELLIVLVVLVILAGMGLLKYIDLRTTAQTAAVAGDIRSVTVAVFNYYAEFETWPEESGPGQVPAGLGKFLPGGLTDQLSRPEYTLDYENITLEDAPLIGVSVSSTNDKLMAKLLATFSTKAPFFVNGSKITYLIAGPGGVF